MNTTQEIRVSLTNADKTFNYGAAMDEVTRAVKELGFDSISPESLEALEEANRDGGWSSSYTRAAYNITMHGFRRLLEPVGGW